MKVIGFTGNYGNGEESLQSYLMADSSILYSGRPFFLPDFAQRFVATPAIVVRTGRLGGESVEKLKVSVNMVVTGAAFPARKTRCISYG
jgi:hypothetical protein